MFFFSLSQRSIFEDKTNTYVLEEFVKWASFVNFKKKIFGPKQKPLNHVQFVVNFVANFYLAFEGRTWKFHLST